MLQPKTLTRASLTFVGFAAFLIMAFGSSNGGGGGGGYTSYHYPTAEEIGQKKALEWAESNSADLARKIHQVQARRDHAESEVRRLEEMREQFPQDVGKTTKRIEEWKHVLTELNRALSTLTAHTSRAYQESQRDGKDAGIVLGEVYRQWSPGADQAIAHAKGQRERTDGSEIQLQVEESAKRSL